MFGTTPPSNECGTCILAVKCMCSAVPHPWSRREPTMRTRGKEKRSHPLSFFPFSLLSGRHEKDIHPHANFEPSHASSSSLIGELANIPKCMQQLMFSAPL
ncbi:hypothetical protein TWF694_002850 [Orbilia ellipsospora]|uniref:Uncharacterized protein n=1 Tax=Orbilia ellipsospora TaxID=2528407 RepID=A0AAV9WZW5_9PEZI